MSNHTQLPAEAPDESANDAELSYAQAQRTARAQTSREAMSKVKELRRQADGARERSRKAQERFENTVALIASEKPERPDWYEHPGVLSRKQIALASGLNSMQMSRVMERYRTRRAKGKKGKRRS